MPEFSNSSYNFSAVALPYFLPSLEVAVKQISILVFTLAAVGSIAVLAQADEKSVDKDKLIGKWKIVMIDGKVPPVDSVLEFTKDGKLVFTFGKDSDGSKVESTYSIDGNKITVTVKKGDNEDKNTETISLNGDKLTITKRDGKKVELERIK